MALQRKRTVLILNLLTLLLLPTQSSLADGGPITDPRVWEELEEGQQIAVVTINEGGTAHTDLFASVLDRSEERHEFTFFVPLGVEARDVDVQEMKGREFDQVYTEVLDQRLREDWVAQQAYRDQMADAVLPGALLLNGGVSAWLGALGGKFIHDNRPRPLTEGALEGSQMFETPSGRVTVYDVDESTDVDALITEAGLPDSVRETLEAVRGQRLAVVTLVTNAEAEEPPPPEPEAQTLRLWDVVSGQEIPKLAFVETVEALAFSPDGLHLAVTAGPHITIWDLSADALVTTLEGRGHILAFSPDGATLAVAERSYLEFWNISTATRTAHWDDEDLQARGFGERISLNHISFSPDGRLVAVAGERLVVLDAATYEHVVSLDARQNASFTSVGFSPDGRWMAATQSTLGDAELYATATWTAQATLREGSHNRGIAFSPGDSLSAEATWVASGDNRGSVWLWSVPGGALAQSLEMDTHLIALAFSADGSALSAVDGNGSIYAWDLATGQLMTRVRSSGGPGGVVVAAYAPGGSRVALGYRKRVSEAVQEQEQETGLRLSWTSTMQPGANGTLVHRYPLGTGKAWANPIPLTRVYVVAPPEVGFEVQTPVIGEDYSGFVRGKYDRPRLRIYDAPWSRPAHALDTIVTPEGQLWRGIYTHANPDQDIIVIVREPLAQPPHYRSRNLSLVRHAWWISVVVALISWLLTWRYLMGRFVNARYSWLSWAFWKDGLYWLFVGPIVSLAFLPLLVFAAWAGFTHAGESLAITSTAYALPIGLLGHCLTASRFARRGRSSQEASSGARFPFHRKAFWEFVVVVLASDALYLTLAFVAAAWLGVAQ